MRTKAVLKPHHSGAGLCWLVLQVSTCLASIAQGVHTKSRAWVARRHNTQVCMGVSAAHGGGCMSHLLPHCLHRYP